MTRREARAIERSAVAEGRRTQRTAATADRRRSHSTPKGWGARRAVVAVFGSVAAVGFLAASLAPVVTPQIAEANQDPSQSTYATAADEAQLFAATEKGGSLAALATVSYEAELRTPTPTPTPTATADADGEPADAPAEGGESGEALPAPYQPPAPYSGGGAPAEWMAAAGIAESDWTFVDYIVSRESGWNPNATNAGSGACGLVQALPCSKVPGNGYDPVDNLRWANGYATGRYGSWASAYAFWTANHWW